MTASAAAEKASFLVKNQKGDLVLKEKHMYYCQVQLGMFFTDLKFCHLVIYSSFDDSCYIVEVEFDYHNVFNEYLPKLQFVYFSFLLTFLADPNNNICDHQVNSDENMNPNETGQLKK